jgi:hypothetical protein
MTDKLVKTLEPTEKRLVKASSVEIDLVAKSATQDYSYVLSTQGQAAGLTPEKLVLPKDYHGVIQMCYDFYQRGGLASTVVNRLAEFSITDIRNGQRKTSNEANEYYDALLHRKPSRLMRFLNAMALEYFLSGMVLPRIDWESVPGSDISPKLRQGKIYEVPVFDMYPPSLVIVEWAGWGQKKFYIKIPEKDIRLIRSGGSQIKEQQLRYTMWMQLYPELSTQIKAGANKVELNDVDPILRKETTFSAYPTPYMYNVLEALLFKQQLRRMDFAVAARIINAILLVQEGDRDFPITEETRENLDDLKNQILARSNNPRMMERLFILFTNHTTKLTWITPDVTAMLNQEKYIQTNSELQEGLGFTAILITGESRSSQAAEVSTYAVQPQMEQFRTMAKEWIVTVYEEAGERNKFANIPSPNFKPIRLQDYVKTAAVFQQAFTEGNISRTTRDESIGTDFETEVELMRDEQPLLKNLPAFPPMPYSPLPPGMVPGGDGRPIGSQNVPVNNRNEGVKPRGQQPTSRLKSAAEEAEILSDEEVINLIDKIARDRGLQVTVDSLEQE